MNSPLRKTSHAVDNDNEDVGPPGNISAAMRGVLPEHSIKPPDGVVYEDDGKFHRTSMCTSDHTRSSKHGPSEEA